MTSFGQKIFNISMSEIEAIVEPYGIANDIGRESMALSKYSSANSINFGEFTWQDPLENTGPYVAGTVQ